MGHLSLKVMEMRKRNGWAQETGGGLSTVQHWEKQVANPTRLASCVLMLQAINAHHHLDYKHENCLCL